VGGGGGGGGGGGDRMKSIDFMFVERAATDLNVFIEYSTERRGGEGGSANNRNAVHLPPLIRRRLM